MSRNHKQIEGLKEALPVTSREGRVSRNICVNPYTTPFLVTSREGRVSRNDVEKEIKKIMRRHVPRGTCE